MQNIFTCYNKNWLHWWNDLHLCVPGSLIMQLLSWLKLTHIHFVDKLKCYHTILDALVTRWTLICTIINTMLLRLLHWKVMWTILWHRICVRFFKLNTFIVQKNMQNKKPLKMTLLKLPRINISWHLTKGG